ncbi:Leucine-rich repeat-containing protein 66 [Anabarilius grahami]|uniref:Leucine-rich repeat-containing protein 66 n=1 Tax=Anabarilius grahami TaxID=495550 RepID=A0A3N0YXF7_ANAGA|nr:Leucine-rich repeat-containing protein 66 [Anabarilius grahami]
MSAYSSVLGVAVLLLHLWGTHSFPTSACPVPCLCQRGPLLNCSSLGLTTIPTRIPATAVSLNLSNNALRSLAPLSFGHVKLMGLQHLWVGSNALESLSMILKKDQSGTRTLSSGEQECTSWASDLQLLSAERNHLKHLPKGLGCMKSLQILQLSYNQISKIGLTDLDNCSYLKELHLQHNSITSIHPHAFIDLKQLQVLDLSFNLLVTIPVPAYQSLRNLNALVDVSFNRWKCDCNLQTLRRWISFDTEMGDASWQVVCASPPHHAGKDLLHLKDSELTCPTHEYSTSGHYHNMIVYEGMKISIPCSNDSKDIMQVHWWTPQGQVTNNQPEFLIKDITKQHAGLYVCISGVRGEHISVFDLRVYKKGSGSRPRREAAIILDEQESFNLPRNDPVVRQGTRTQSEFVLAVCLSVIITFILAFILGVVLRPLLDKLWRRIRSKRQSTPPPPPPTTTTSSTGPQPYVNEGYCDVEDQEQVRVGSRVTFGGITVQDQMPYYVTVEDDQADGSSESNTEADNFYETIENNKSSIANGKQQALEVENHRGRADSSSSSSVQEGEVNALVINGKKLPPSSTKGMPKSMEFEPIPDANDITQIKRRGSSSASSHSSQEDNVSREFRESSVDPPPTVTIPANKNTKGRSPGFTTEPFSEWSSRLTEQNVDDLDPEMWNDSGESFSFTEGSERSSIRDLSSSALGHPLKDDDTWRQGKVESPSDKINIDSEVFDFGKPFGKEVLVDDVKQFELSDIASDSNSSDESAGGPNSYTVNTELEEESDTENSANLVSLNRFGSLEDVTFNERMPSAGILIRQETITLEPSEINLTFTHEDSIDEGMPIDDSQGNNKYVNISDKFALCVDMSLDTVPKIKRYVEFKQSKPHFGLPTLPTSEMAVKSEANIDASSGDNRCLSQIEVSPDTIKKVKRYIHFKQPEPHSPTLPSSPSSIKKDAILEAKSYSSSSEDDAQLTTQDDNSFRTIGVSSDEVSKVKRYISFKQFDSVKSRPSTNIETTTEATINSIQPSTSPKDSSQSVKKYMYFKQHERHSSSLPASPTSSRKGLSVKKTKYKKRHDQSFYGSHESLPLYHVHPVYRSSINRMNRGYDTDRSISSEDEDQFMEYPRKLEITIPSEMNRGSITPDKNTDKVLNIDFDNSSSSTDVFEKKHSKGLMRLRTLSARLFNRHENETDERRSPTGLDVGRTSGVSIKKQPKLTKEPTTNEDILFERSLSLDHLPKVKRYLQFSHSDSYLQVQLPSPSPTTGIVTPDFIVTTESRRSSFSSEDDVKQTTEDKIFVGQVDASYEGLPKPESRRSSTSSEDDIKPTSNEDNFFRKIGISLDTVPHVKRCIQFSQPKPYSPTQTSLPVTSKRPVVAVETSSSTSDKSDEKSNATGTFLGGQIGLNAVPKVKRYVQFTQFKSHSPTLSSVSSSSTKVTPKIEVKTEAKIDRSSEDQGNLTQIEVSPESIKKVKRYIHFKQSEPHSPLSHSLTKKDAILETRRYSSSSEDDVQLTTNKDSFFRKIGASFDGVSKVKGYITFKQFDPSSDTTSDKLHVTHEVRSKSEARRSSTSSEDDVKLTAEEDNVFGQTEASLDRVPRVKRYIQFTHPESQSPVQTTTGLLSERVNISVMAKETRRWSTSSEEDVKPSIKEDNIIGETGEYLAEIPKVKRYIKFTQSEPYSSDLSLFPPSKVKSIKVSETEYRESTSSEDDFQEENSLGQIGASLDRVPRVKRYIEFTHPESQFPAQTTALSAERASVSVIAKEPRRSSTSSEDVKPSTNKDKITEETSEYFAKIPKIKRYIKFTQAEQHSLDLSPFPPSSAVKSIKVTETELRQPATRESTSFEDDVQEDIELSLDRVPRVKRYIKFTHPESQSLARSTSVVSAERVGISGENQVTKRSITSFEEDVTLTAKEDNVFGHIGASLDKIPKVKRYIQFTKPESEPLVQTTTDLLSERLGISGVFQETRSSTSSEVDVKPSTHYDNVTVERGDFFDKIPKVKRYINFTQSEPTQGFAPFPLPSNEKSIKVTETESRGSSTLVEDAQPYPKEKEDNVLGQTEARLDSVPRVKRYIQFKQQSPEQSTTGLSAERVGISKVITETRRLNISSEDDATLTAKEDYFGGRIGAPFDIPKVKRYIRFTHPESQYPVQATTALSDERVNVSVVAKETRRPSTSSEEDVKPSTNDANIVGEKGEPLDNIPKVKRYIEFTKYEPYSSAQSHLPSANVVKPIKMTATELRGSSTSVDVQPATNGNKTEAKTLGTSSDNLDRIPRVKRYIHFIPAESQYPARSSTSVLTERVGISGVAQETRIPSTSSIYVKPSSTDYNIVGETDKSFAIIPKVKKYIQFTQSEPHSSTVSSFLSSNTVKSINIGEVQENQKYRTSYDDVKQRRNHDDNFFQEIGVSLNKIPKVKRYVTFTKNEPSSTKLMKKDLTPSDSMKKGSALIIKTESESRTSGFSFKDSVMTKESMNSSVEHTGLKSSLRSLSSDKQYVGHQVMDVQPPQDHPPAVPQTPPPPLEQKDASEYLRENSEVLQRLERRRLLQQRRMEMDKFNIASLSSMQQEGGQQDKSPRDYGGATQLPTEQTHSSISAINTATSRHTEGAEAPVLRGLKTKNISTPKYKEFLI